MYARVSAQSFFRVFVLRMWRDASGLSQCLPRDAIPYRGETIGADRMELPFAQTATRSSYIERRSSYRTSARPPTPGKRFRRRCRPWPRHTPTMRTTTRTLRSRWTASPTRPDPAEDALLKIFVKLTHQAHGVSIPLNPLSATIRPAVSSSK